MLMRPFADSWVTKKKKLDETVRAANIAIDERIRFQQRNITTTVANDDLAQQIGVTRLLRKKL